MKGILFKPDMIKAIVEGRKTVTRRAINPQPPVLSLGGNFSDNFSVCGRDYNARYQVGEPVYIKEAYGRWGSWNKNKFVPVSNTMGGIRYLDNRPPFLETDRTQTSWFKRSPLFMPAWAARYFIKITDVRAERTRDITPEDCLLEGIIFAGGCYWTSEDGVAFDTAQEAYFALYDSINGKGSHENNWDWRYEFNFQSPSGVEEKI